MSKLSAYPFFKAFRHAARPTSSLTTRFGPRISLIAVRLLSAETRKAIDKAVASAPVVLFMKGTPETPQCGFSRASIQILGLQGVDPAKFTAFNVLEDEELRQGMYSYVRQGIPDGNQDGKGNGVTRLM
jgi:monothiol glutaredoxin